MKIFIISIILLFPILLSGQTRIDTLFSIGDSYYQNKVYTKAKDIYENLKLELEKGTNDYRYASDQVAMIYFMQRNDLRNQEKYEESVKFLNEFIEYIESEKDNIRPLWYIEKRYFLIKTIIQNYFSLNQFDKAKEYQNILYQAYKENLLPEGINQYYSFEMFKWEDKNIWGYEYYPDLGDPETEGSFSKIVYYVYSTDKNGLDKEQLYRLHVLKVHKIDDKTPDFVLTKRLEKAKNEVSGTLWSYTYNSPIDYKKLKKDIMEVLKGNYQPKTK